MNHYGTQQQALGLLNEGLQARYVAGEAIHVDVHGRPELHILSFDPLIHNAYGGFRNRAPYLAGSAMLRKFVSQPHPSGDTMIIVGVEKKGRGYGFCFTPGEPDTADPIIIGVARLLGTEIELTR